jgi:tRNA(Leu) C34 or U34 (ribose-2'-O)-methylase TrmL
VLDAAVGFAMHRGILAVGRHIPASSFDAFLSGLPEKALLVAACGIANHDNIGGIFRNAGVFGADGVVLDTSCCDPLYRKAIRVSVGAALRVPFCRAGSIEQMVAALSARGFEVAGLSPQGAEALSSFEPAPRLALLAGTEGEGLPADLIARIRTLRIEQAPGMDSLNVATASGIALWHAVLSDGADIRLEHPAFRRSRLTQTRCSRFKMSERPFPIQVDAWHSRGAVGSSCGDVACLRRTPAAGQGRLAQRALRVADQQLPGAGGQARLAAVGLRSVVAALEDVVDRRGLAIPACGQFHHHRRNHRDLAA